MDVTQSIIFVDSDYVGFSFPPTARIQTDNPSWLAKPDENDLTWMTDAQVHITSVYGWFAVAVAIAFVLTLFGRSIYLTVVSIFVGAYEVSKYELY